MAKKSSLPKQNWFETLNAALEAEDLVKYWELGLNIGYGETVSMTADDGSRYGKYITIYRSDTGMYERPIHYKR